jgi:hypothetical protein
MTMLTYLWKEPIPVHYFLFVRRIPEIIILCQVSMAFLLLVRRCHGNNFYSARRIMTLTLTFNMQGGRDCLAMTANQTIRYRI